MCTSGCQSLLAGYLPVRGNSQLGPLSPFSSSSASSSPSPPAVLLCQGGQDPVAPAEWARVAAEKLRGQRRALAALASAAAAAEEEEEEEEEKKKERAGRLEESETVGRVELLVCEHRGHDLAPDDVWRARWWLRSRLVKRPTDRI